jgi:hypothetical protein
LFADDAKLYFVHDPLVSTDEFQTDLYALAHWSNMWQLTIAVSKTFMMYFGFHNKHRIYKLNGVDIVEQNVVRDLGVYIASDFSWHSHCVQVARKANIIANAILHSFVSQDINIYMQAFYSYVRPILEFNCFVWSPTLCGDIDVIENVQKCFTRRVFKKCDLPRLSYIDRLDFINCDTLEKRRLYISLCNFYNIYNNYVCCNILEGFHTSLSHLRGNTCRLFVPFCKTSVRKNFFTLRLLPLWNALPNTTVTSNVTTAFKSRLTFTDFSEHLRL